MPQNHGSLPRVLHFSTGIPPAPLLDRRLQEALEIGMISSGPSGFYAENGRGFGATFECYVAAVCVNELASIAYWGVEVEGLTGDYDVILMREDQLGYVECKAGRLQNLTDSELRNFLERELLLAPSFSVFMFDNISQDSVVNLAQRLHGLCKEYSWAIPGVMHTIASPLCEEYRAFARVLPINCFITGTHPSVEQALIRIYQFLTVVRDRSLIVENESAKQLFELRGVHQ